MINNINLFLVSLTFSQELLSKCNIPFQIKGDWYSWENGQSTITKINAESMNVQGIHKGNCIDMKEEFHTNFTFVFRQDVCFHCVKFIVRTINVLDKLECKYFLIFSLHLKKIFFSKLSVSFSAQCVNLPSGVVPSVENVCRGLRSDQQLITLFSENYVPYNCRSSLEGVWQFAYQV